MIITQQEFFKYLNNWPGNHKDISCKYKQIEHLRVYLSSSRWTTQNCGIKIFNWITWGITNLW